MKSINRNSVTFNLRFFLPLLWGLLFFSVSGFAQQKVMVIEIRDQIDPRMSRYVDLALEEAAEREVDYLVIDMDTYGGAVNDADAIRMNLLEFEKPVFVFINKNAASAGALISIACDSIYMAAGASIGAATVVNGADGSQAPDKYQSYMRSTMRSTAEAQGRNPAIAEAMVDENLEVEGVSEAGQVLTLTTSEAIENGFCEAEVNSMEELLQRNGINDYELISFELGIAEQIIALVLNPFVSGILVLVILGGIYFELQSPGVGFPILAAIVAALLYFIPYYLNGLAAHWEIICFIVGVILIALEVFVIPGFGIAGITGLVLTVGSLILVMIANDNFDFTFVTDTSVFDALIVTFTALVGGLILALFAANRLGLRGGLSNVALKDTLSKEEGYTSKFTEEDLIGRTGKAYTVLRPGGKVIIDEEIYDATSKESFIDKDETIKVVDQEGNWLKVRKGS